MTDEQYDNLSTATTDNGSPYVRKAAKGASINLLGAIARTMSIAMYSILLARLLPVAEYGNYSLMFSLISLLGLISVIGLDFGVVRHVSLFAGVGDYSSARKTLYSALYLGVPVGVVVALTFFIVAPDLAASRMFNGSDLVLGSLRLFSLTIPLWVAARLFNAATQGMHRMEYQVYSRDVGEQMSRFLFSALAALIGAGLLGIIWANVAAMALATLLAMFFAFKVMPRSLGSPAAVSPARKVFMYSLPLAFSNVVGIVLLQSDTLLLGYLGTSEDVGFYSAALRVAMLSSTILIAFSTMFAPIISDLSNKDEFVELAGLFRTVARWIFVFSFPLFIIMVIFPHIVMTVFGAEYSEGSGALTILALGQLLNAGTGTAGLMVLMSGRSKLELLNVSIALLVNVIGCLLLIPPYGIIGAAIANMLAVGTVNLCRGIEVWIFMRIHAYGRSFLKPVLAGVSGAGILLLLSRFIAIDGGAVNATVFASAFLVYYAAATILMGLDENDKVVLRLMRQRITSGRPA